MVVVLSRSRQPHAADSSCERARQKPPPTVLDASDNGGVFRLSLPHWTRRILPIAPSARRGPAGAPHPDVHNPALHRDKLLLEKELPPTPSGPSTLIHEPAPHPNDARVSISVQHAIDSPSQRARYLDVYHSPQVNSVAFSSFPNGSADDHLRKTKSTHSLRPAQPSSTPQRTRGISMTHLFTSKRGSTSPPTTAGNPPATPLARKSTFWSRKFSTSSLQHPTTPADSPSLPAPNSPLRVGFTAPPDLSMRSRSSSTGARLSRRHSEHSVHPSSTPRDNILSQVPPLPGETNVRPSTADPQLLASCHSPMRRPTTADSATSPRLRSLFATPHQPTLPPGSQPFFTNAPSRTKATPNSRQCSSTNPPLLHRLSVNLFTSSPPSRNSSPFSSSPISRSPRPSLSQIPPDVLKPRASESSDTFVSRLVSFVSKADIVGVLASNGDAIYSDSLKLFMERFRFQGDPLDVALRRLLMDVGLPRETQQIDRVIQSFANRYLSCNPDLFASGDDPYILAFSLIMLHTDTFNKSNKRKMSKVDYLKNTTLPGLIPDVLDCFYDNIVFAPFIFIEDPLDPEGNAEGNLTRPSTSSGLPSPMLQGGNTLLSRPKVDPYYLITNNLLDQLRVDVKAQIPLENPFRWSGTGVSWNYDDILLAFAKGHMVHISSADMRTATPFFGLSVMGPSLNGLNGMPERPHVSQTWTIKFVKVAVLNRKDELLERGKRPSNRKWRPYSVALTKSHLFLFRDLSWSSTLLTWNDPPRKPPISSTSFRPDEVISLDNTLAVLDQSYSKHLNAFRLTTHDGRHILFQATEEKEMDGWISLINYASTFKTTGIRMRSLGMTGEALELTGVAAATSHLHDLQLAVCDQPRMMTWDHCHPPEPTDKPPVDGRLYDRRSTDINDSRRKLEDPSSPEAEGSSQFRETFDTVKAELAAARVSAGDLSVAENSVRAEPPRLASRVNAIHTRVKSLENRICATNMQIKSSMHVARNIAILAPFQKSTRDRLHDTIQTLSRKIQTMRLDVTKLICHRSILLNDLAVEEKNFKQATSAALQAAAKALQQQHSECPSHASFSSQDLEHRDSFAQESPLAGSKSFDSSTYDTFRSALDFGPDWPSSGEAFASQSLWGPPPTTDSPVTPGHDSMMGHHPSLGETSYMSFSTTNQLLPNALPHENSPVIANFAEEQAEEWSKTRAAKRVSLVKLPSDLRISAIGKSRCHPPGDHDSLKEDFTAGEAICRT